MSLSKVENSERKVWARYDWSFNARQSKDTDKCAIVAITCLSDGRIVILDHCNNALKIFDHNCQLTFQQEVDENCYGIAHVSENNIVVTKGKRLCFFRVMQDKLKNEHKRFELDQQMFAISCERNHLVVSAGSDEIRFIRILDSNGKIISEIKSKEIFGRVLIVGDFFRLHPSEDLLLISDGENKRIICMSLSGEALWEKTFNGYPADILMIGSDTLVVLPDENEIWITKENEANSELYISKTDGLLDPNLLAYDNGKKILLVTHRLLQNDVDAFKTYPGRFVTYK